jgi:cellulose synthase/poly-beta-1,6-N-acetylglucosamine synthase-like glycosyltransferase
LTESCAIIIPAIRINEDVQKCVNECLAQKKIKTSIYLITNKKVNQKLKIKKVKYLYFGDVNMSTKRNIAVKKCKDNYIAFIDSDAYPAKNWVFNGIQLLKKNKKISIITGPDLPFPDQKGWSFYIGLAHKSFLLSGEKVFRKNLKKEMICNQASSCNMILRKKDFLKVGGMDENIYIGEDKDLCDKINVNNKILYSPKVLIYHKVRDFVPFILQRFYYGTILLDLIKKNKILNLNNFQYFGPLIILLFYLFLPLSIIFNYFEFVFLMGFMLLNSIVIFESLKITYKINQFWKIFFIIKLNILSFGLGSLLNILGLKKVNKIYTKR